MTGGGSYIYRDSVKSDVSDELVNTYLIRPLAGLLVRILYHMPITPNQVTIAAAFAGMIAAWLYTFGTPEMILIAGLTVTVKDLLDSVDGQLARAKHLYSRAGRFIDSIGDFAVNAAVLCAISVVLARATGKASIPFLGLLSFLGISLRVSYHVFYQTSFLHLQNTYTLNRLTEEVRNEDRAADRFTLFLQQIFQFLYGWQDAMMLKIDTWCRLGLPRDPRVDNGWYADRTGLRLSGFLGLGTELFVLMICSVANRLELYLYINVCALNGLWLVCIAYRRFALRPRLTHG